MNKTKKILQNIENEHTNMIGEILLEHGGGQLRTREETANEIGRLLGLWSLENEINMVDFVRKNAWGKKQ